MNKKELKQILKPLIKECIKEVIFEDGTLSAIISEVVQGVGQPIVEAKQRFPKKKEPKYETDEQAKARLDAKRKKMTEVVGRGSYNGVDLFEGTTPTPAQNQQGKGALSDVDPSDPGVDISSFMGKSSVIWQKMAGKDGK
jgi:hypothetical protein